MESIKGTAKTYGFTIDGVKGTIDGFYFVTYGTTGCHVSAIGNKNFRLELINLLFAIGDSKMAMGMLSPKNTCKKAV
jgi:hypothetical protein